MLPLKMEWLNSTKNSLSFLQHHHYQSDWKELYLRFLRSAIVFGLCTVGTLFYYQKIWTIFLAPLKNYYPDFEIISMSVASPFFLTWTLCFYCAFLLTLCWAMIELFFFLKPALYLHEKKTVKIAFPGACFLIFLGQYSAWAYLFPRALSFFLNFNQEIAVSFFDIRDLISLMILFHKIVFLMTLWPFILGFLLMLGWVRLESLEKARPYIYVCIFFIGMILTPPDVVLQLCVALPLIFFFEVALAIGPWIFRQSN